LSFITLMIRCQVNLGVNEMVGGNDPMYGLPERPLETQLE
jgi:hypothetical protein